MIGKILERGSDVGGLLRYLFGPGEANEHTDQRVIAADERLEIPAGTRLSMASTAQRGRIAELGREMDSHRRLADLSFKDGWVWHCTISLPPGEQLDDEKWAHVARTVVSRLGFVEDREHGRAACRWIAVHHGPSAQGNDHIHIGVNLVREDLTLARPGLVGPDGAIRREGMDKKAMSAICGGLERELNLTVVEGRAGRGMPSYSRGEQRRVEKGARPEHDRTTLARCVRAAALAADNEGAFVDRLRAQGVTPLPRHSKDGKVVGYAVALPPARAGDKLIPFAGGSLAKDLTLPRLREQWPDSNPAEHRAAWTTKTPTLPAPRQPEPSEQVWQEAADQIDALRSQGEERPDEEWLTYTARYASATMAVLSLRLEGGRPGPWADVGDVLACSAQSPRRISAPRRTTAAWRSVARVCEAVVPGRKDGGLKLTLALIRLIALMYEVQIAERQARRAVALAEVSNARLALIDPQAAAEIREAFALRLRRAGAARLRSPAGPGSAVAAASLSFPHSAARTARRRPSTEPPRPWRSPSGPSGPSIGR